jgi:hypothetical protein
MRVQFSPPLLLRHTRAFEKWKKTRPVGSRPGGAGTTAVKKPKPTSDKPEVAEAQFWKTVGGVLLRFVRIPDPWELPMTVFVLSWL